MERGSKRKSGAAALTASSPSEGRAAKRQKTPEPPLTLKINNPNAATTPTSSRRAGGAVARETVESTTETGQKFLDQLRNARDKHGRLIATSFLKLPERAQLPDYYEHIKLPISIETMQEKLSSGEFSTLTQVESDIKRMVNNAKSFNETKSDVYLDAERIRKMTSNFMLKNNPAYKDKNYSAFPTPIPDEVDSAPVEEETTPIPASRSRAHSKAEEESLSADAHHAAAEDGKYESRDAEEADAAEDATGETKEEQNESDGSFENKTFQEAQELIATEMIEFKDDSGLAIFTPFINLPARSLTDYYAVIKQPTSLNGIKKKVRGVRGRGEGTGVTGFKSWDAFEAEYAKIWNNAREYNQDGSEMFLLAGELESHFRERLAQARKAVDEPQQPTLKLNLSSKPPAHIKLRLGARGSDSPAPPTRADTKTQSPAPATDPSTSKPASAKSTPAPPNGVNVDENALKRQQEDVQASVDGLKASDTSKSQTSARVPLRSNSQSVDSSAATQANGVKTESNKELSPASSAVRPSSAASDAPNGVGNGDAQKKAPSLSSSVPSTQSIQSVQSVKNTSESPAPITLPQDPTQFWIPMHPPPIGMESRFRANGKDASDALITNVHLSSHPELPIARPFHQDIRPHANLTQQSVTLNLPATHYNLRLQPALAASLTHDLSTNPSLANTQLSSSGSNRPYKLFVTVNGQRMQPSLTGSTSALAPGNSYYAATATMTSMSPPPPVDAARSPERSSESKLMYDVKLLPGLNRVEVECVATPTNSSTSTPANAASTTNAKHDLEMERVTIFVHLLRVSL